MELEILTFSLKGGLHRRVVIITISLDFSGVFRFSVELEILKFPVKDRGSFRRFGHFSMAASLPLLTPQRLSPLVAARLLGLSGRSSGRRRRGVLKVQPQVELLDEAADDALDLGAVLQVDLRGLKPVLAQLPAVLGVQDPSLLPQPVGEPAVLGTVGEVQRQEDQEEGVNELEELLPARQAGERGVGLQTFLSFRDDLLQVLEALGGVLVLGRELQQGLSGLVLGEVRRKQTVDVSRPVNKQNDD